MLIKMRMVKEVLSEPLNLCTLACVIKKKLTTSSLEAPHIQARSAKAVVARTYAPTGRNFSIPKLYARYRRAPPREIRISEKRRSERSGNCEAVSPPLVGETGGGWARRRKNEEEEEGGEGGGCDGSGW